MTLGSSRKLCLPSDQFSSRFPPLGSSVGSSGFLKYGEFADSGSCATCRQRRGRPSCLPNLPHGPTVDQVSVSLRLQISSSRLSVRVNWSSWRSKTSFGLAFASSRRGPRSRTRSSSPIDSFLFSPFPRFILNLDFSNFSKCSLKLISYYLKNYLQN